MYRLLYVLAGAVVGWFVRERYKAVLAGAGFGNITNKTDSGVILVHPDLVAAAADAAVKNAGTWSATAKELCQRWAASGDSALSMPEIQQFQSECGLIQTSTLDDATRASLAGCAQDCGAAVPVMVTGPMSSAVALAQPGDAAP